MSQARFQKMQREKARQEKAAAKAARREARQSETTDDVAPPDDAEQADVLAELAALHERFEAGTVTFDDFVEAKEALTERLHIS